MARLSDPLRIGDVTLPNRLYRAPLLECAGNGEDAVDRLIDHLEPAAAAGAGLVCQGATIVRGEGGCAAPGMTRVHDPDFVARLGRLTDRLHEYDAAVAIQLEHGGLRSMETWHAGYRDDHPDLQQLAVSRPPALLRTLDRLGFLHYDSHVLTTAEVYDLADDFGRAAGRAVDADYDIVHLAGANMGIVHQFLSPFYNRRDDEFGDGVRFLEAVHDAVRDHAGDVPLMTKVPAETAAPPVIRRRLTRADAVDICRRLDRIGYDALVPVSGSVFWDMSIVRGQFPARAWRDEGFREGYAEAFGGRLRAGLVALANRIQSHWYDFEPAWNADLCRTVRDAVSVPVLCEGGIRERPRIDRLLNDACDAVGMARPFYAEPELPARLLADGEASAVCASCNNCAVPQVTGAPGVCRTPAVLDEVGKLRKSGAYDRE
ncbi:oxidoreductase [Haloplanus aerogenes]|uniref:2,4-dienoyl-CoA reductase-like NADH-dependent reductase (Old Yellow Enzyme family) n=1 Tax=Haloplanus aerogenes TaxID=660522 RepID=A0A3M0DTN6_9EURY|nr:NADH:flavin oxidoreductase [Haloplanus aerogenes]AZH25603.1 NADH:flavin oxidoreductase [Haloplanus aerogenes]RMB25325.1 2,4-dienoyl-CoA reductase-like NADH-dependent reductase (Old Yellow Enzyme family) [Haloplanus aerogenes]